MSMWQRIQTWLSSHQLGNPLWLWAAAFAVMVVSFLALLLARRLLSRHVGGWASRTNNRFGLVATAMFRGTRVVFLAALAILFASYVVDLGQRAEVLRRIVLVVTLIQAAVWSVAFLTGILDVWRARRAADPTAATLIGTAHVGVKVVVWSIVVLLALDNMGVRLTTLVASLGIGGVAAALAVQSILGDIFASVSIVLDKPFEVGDFIVVGDLAGTVEHVGLKSTRVRSLSGEQLVFANADLLASRIRNFKRMQERRVAFNVNVTYDTPADKLEAIPSLMRSVVESQREVRFDRAHFARFGDYALVFEVVYFVVRPDHNLSMDIQQAINLAIRRAFDAQGIDFGLPTQAVILQRRPAPAAG